MAARMDCRARDHHGYAHVRGYDHDRDYLRDRDHRGSDQMNGNAREVCG